jgi:4-hydroxy-2-oxoheptanedioate aldolase
LTPATLQPLNRLRKLWRERRPTFGAIATIPSIQTVQIMARSGFDWIVVDLEHGPIDLGSAHVQRHQVRPAYRWRGSPPTSPG